MFEGYRAKRQLKKVREDLQTLYDEAQRRRPGVHDKYPHAEELLNSREAKVYKELKEEEYWLSTFLKVTPEWGTAKALYRGEPDSPDAYMRVREDHSTKISFEYVELVDMMVRTINGKWSPTRWDWETVDKFKQQGWGRDEAFHDAVDEWHAAETPEAKQEVIDKYKEENPQWSL